MTSKGTVHSPNHFIFLPSFFMGFVSFRMVSASEFDISSMQISPKTFSTGFGGGDYSLFSCRIYDSTSMFVISYKNSKLILVRAKAETINRLTD